MKPRSRHLNGLRLTAKPSLPTIDIRGAIAEAVAAKRSTWEAIDRINRIMNGANPSVELHDSAFTVASDLDTKLSPRKAHRQRRRPLHTCLRNTLRRVERSRTWGARSTTR